MSRVCHARASTLPSGYTELLEELTRRIAGSQTRAALAITRELVLLYWSIGAEILVRQRAEGVQLDVQ